MKFKFLNSADSYGLVNKHFHWIMAAIIIFNFILALILDDFPKGPMRSFLFSIHKSTGILVIILLIPRLLWRLVNTGPFEVFGLFTAPALIENNQVVASIAKEIHGISVYIFITVLGIHVLASLLHHYIFKDKTLKRMWYGDSN